MSKFKGHTTHPLEEPWKFENISIKDPYYWMCTNYWSVHNWSNAFNIVAWFFFVLCVGPCIYRLFILCQADADGNGSLDYGEFVTLSVHLRKIGNDEHLHKAFAYFDRNQSGYIEIDELRESLADDLGQNHEEVINAIIRDVDTDKVCTCWSISSKRMLVPFSLLV